MLSISPMLLSKYRSNNKQMKYNIFHYPLISHYVPKQSRTSKVTSIVFMTALVIVAGGMIAYSIVMFGTN